MTQTAPLIVAPAGGALERRVDQLLLRRRGRDSGVVDSAAVLMWCA